MSRDKIRNLPQLQHIFQLPGHNRWCGTPSRRRLSPRRPSRAGKLGTRKLENGGYRPKQLEYFHGISGRTLNQRNPKPGHTRIGQIPKCSPPRLGASGGRLHPVPGSIQTLGQMLDNLSVQVFVLFQTCFLSPYSRRKVLQVCTRIAIQG